MIVSIYIRNFKSIIEDSTEIPNFAAIVGLNAAGKTNLIQAIGLINDLVNGLTLEMAIEKIAFPLKEIFNYTNQSSSTSCLKIEIKNGEETSYSLEIEIGIRNEAGGFPKIFIDTEKLIRITESSKDIIYTRNAEGLKKGSGEPIPLSVDSNKLAVKLYNENTVLKFRHIMSKIVILDGESFSNKESIAKQDDQGLASMLITLRHRPSTETKNFELFQQVVKKLLPSFSSIVEVPQPTEPLVQTSEEKRLYAVLLEEKGLNETLSMKSISSGDLKTLYLIAHIVNMEEGSTLIVEEIENGLHHKRLSEIIDRLDIIATRKNIQLLFTTHSYDVINKLKPSQVLFAKKENVGSKYTILEEAKDIVLIEKFLKKGGSLTDMLNKIEQ
jgi:predicted ATPase